MNLINTVSYYMNLIFGVTIAFIAIVGGLLYYLLKIKKVTATTEKINYDRFERRDILEYLKFDDIISGDDDKAPGMIQFGDYIFVGGISVFGYNQAAASEEERERTRLNSVTFFNIVDNRIQMRQSAKAADFSKNIKQHEDIAEQIAGEIYLLQEEYEETVRIADDYVDSPEYTVYEEKILKLQKELQTKRHFYDEVQEELWYMNRMSGVNQNNNQKTNQLMFSYVYNPADYTEELSKEEIMDKALDELHRMANSYGEGLIRAGMSFRRLSKKELIDLMRKQLCPVTGEEVKLEDLFASSYDTLFVTSDSLLEFERRKREDAAFNELVAQREQDEMELLNGQRLDAMRSARLLQKEIAQMVDEMEVPVE